MYVFLPYGLFPLYTESVASVITFVNQKVTKTSPNWYYQFNDYVVTNCDSALLGIQKVLVALR